MEYGDSGVPLSRCGSCGSEAHSGEGWDPPKLSPGERTRTAGQLRSPSLGTGKGRRGGRGAGPRGRRLGGRGSADTAPACRRGPRVYQVCEAAVGAENLPPQPARPAEPGLPRGLWGHPSAPPGRPHAAPGACPAAR